MATKIYHIALTSGRSQYGDVFVGGAAGMPGGFSVNLPGMTCDIWLSLRGQTQSGAGTTKSYAVFEVLLPQEYTPGTNGSVVVNCQYAGTGTGLMANVDVQVYRQDGSEEVTGDLVTTDSQNITADWANYTFAVSGAALLPGDRVVITVETNVGCDQGGSVQAQIGEVKLLVQCQEPTMNASDVANLNVDSTGGELTLAKALEVIAARCVGNLAYDADTGEVTLYGRDGQTPVATVTLTGGGNRTQSTIS